ncbi:MAG: L,D-transpeptidase [Candidatus Velamenicoccus archaeovorus]
MRPGSSGPVRAAAATLLLVAAAACTSPSPPPGTSPSPAVAAPSPVPSATPSPGPAEPALRPGVTYAAVPLERYLPIYRTPGAPRAAFALDTLNGTDRIAPLLVVGHRRAEDRLWLRLQLPLRPNGRTGWALPDDVRLAPRHQEIVVDLSSRTLWRTVDGRVTDRFPVGVGLSSTPTAIGTFFVWVKVSYDDPSGPYGPFALGLSGFSPVLSEWPGGGRMAIHGTSDPADRGREVSHGCVRVYTPQLLRLRDVPLGTPVVIRP